MALDWENIIVEDDENNALVQDTPVTVMTSGTPGQPIAWDKIVIVDEETSVEGEDQNVMIFASGIPGQSATIDEVTAVSLEPGAEPTVENYGSGQNARFRFGIPKGEKGEPGSEWGGIGGDIDDQTDLAEALNSKADSDNVYTKLETDSLLDDKADSDDVYTKAQVDTALSTKANADDVYTQDEADTLLADKAAVITETDSGSIVHIEDGANDAPVLGLTVDIEPVQSGSGDPAPDNIRPISGHTSATITRTGKNLFSYETIPAYAYAWYSGSTALADATQPILVRAGYTYKLQAAYDTQYADATPLVRAWRTDGTILENEPSVLNVKLNASSYLYSYMTTPKYYQAPANGDKWNPWQVIIQPTEDLWLDIRNSSGRGIGTSVQLELGSTATSYEPYTAQQVTIPLGQTVYGGTLDVKTGTLTVDRFMFTLTGDTSIWQTPSSWFSADENRDSIGFYWYFNYMGFSNLPKPKADTYANLATYARSNSFIWGTYGVYSQNTHYIWSIMSSSSAQPYLAIRLPKSELVDISTAAKANESCMSWLNTHNIQFVYPIAEPLVYQLTPQQLSTLLGVNNIFSDTGDVTVGYRADTKLYIQRLTQPTEDDMVANANIASGKFFSIGNSLYFSTAAISAGETIIIGSNCTAISLADALNQLNQ